MTSLKTKKVSLKTIAEMAGCSTTTVSNILNAKGLFGEKIRDKVMKLVKKYNYTINASARSLRMGKSETIALVFYRPNVDIFKSEYYLTMMYGLQKRLAELGFEILLSEVSQSDEEKNRQPRFVSRGKADAIVALGRVPENIVKLLGASELPMLMLDSYSENVDSIYTDGKKATAEMTDHLVSLGHKNIAYFAYDNFDFNTDMRIKGFRQSVKKAGLEHSCRLYRNFKTNEEACGVFEDVLSRVDRPTAILSSNDSIATSLICRAQTLGLRIPQDVAFCGYDDTILAVSCTPNLTTAHVDCALIGEFGAETVVSRLENPSAKTVVKIFNAPVVVRESTRGK